MTLGSKKSSWPSEVVKNRASAVHVTFTAVFQIRVCREDCAGNVDNSGSVFELSEGACGGPTSRVACLLCCKCFSLAPGRTVSDHPRKRLHLTGILSASNTELVLLTPLPNHSSPVVTARGSHLYPRAKALAGPLTQQLHSLPQNHPPHGSLRQALMSSSMQPSFHVPSHVQCLHACADQTSHRQLEEYNRQIHQGQGGSHYIPSDSRSWPCVCQMLYSSKCMEAFR